MNLFKRTLVLAACVFLFASAAHAQHILKLMDGRILKGEFISASGGAINFKVVGDAEPTRFDIADVLSVVFSTASPIGLQKREEPISVPKGHVIAIQFSEEVSSRASTAGEKFFATLVSDLEQDGVVLARAGKRVAGRVRKVLRPKRSVDKAVIEVTLIEIPVDGKSVPVITDWAGVVNDGRGTTSTTGPAVVTNATMDELVDGNNVLFPVGTRVEFRLAQPLIIRPPLN